MSDFGYDFGSKFMQTKGQPFSYGNKELAMIHKFPVMKGDVLTVTIEETNSKLIQGVGITEEVEIFGRLSKRPVIWETFSMALFTCTVDACLGCILRTAREA